MSYLVLARKYRPRHFGEMVGQEHVVRALTNALDSQRLHHAYLFTGTRGVGKTTVARILAKSLNCLGPDGQGDITSTPCGVCQACIDIDAGRFIDYTELDAASNRGIDDVQTLLEQAIYKPVQGRFKVFMIDEVHMLTTQAFNAMLKTLEEPPDYLKFVLATTDPQKVPVTVLSRCLQFNLRPMAPETVREHLTRVLEAEAVPVDEPALRLLARAARGSMRDALSLTDQAIAFGAGQLTQDSVRQMLGGVDRTHVLRLIEALAVGDGRTVVETVEQLRVNGLNPASVLEDMGAVLQRMAVFQLAPDAIDTTDPDAQDMARLAELMPVDETQLLYSMCLHASAELGLAPDEYAALTMVLLRLLAFKPASPSVAPQEKKTLRERRSGADAPLTPPAAQMRAAPPDRAAPTPVGENAPRAAASTPVVVARAMPRAPSGGRHLSVMLAGAAGAGDSLDAVRRTPTSTDEPSGNAQMVAVPVRTQPQLRDDLPHSGQTQSPLVPTEDGDFWFATVQQLMAAQSITALARELALQSQLVGRDSDQWMLKVEREALQQAGSRERLTAALQGAGHAVSLLVEVGRVTDSPARRLAAAAMERQLAAERIIFEDPFVQTMMREFGAKIVPGSIRPL